MVKNMLWLRTVMILGASLEMIYAFFIAPEPLWEIISWAVVWIIVNAVQLALLIKEKMGLKFNDDEIRIYRLVFSSLPELHFKKLLSVARWESCPENTVLIEEEVRINSLMLIYSGIAAVSAKEKTIAYLRDGNFMGEMSFITGNLTSARVKTLSPTRYLIWDRENLNELLLKNKELEDGLKSVFNVDLINKLTNNHDKKK